MYKWEIELNFKNGNCEICTYEGNEANSNSVADKILQGKEGQFCGLKQGDRNLLYKLGEISYVKITPCKY